MSLTCAPLTPSSSYCLQENNAFVLCRVVPQKLMLIVAHDMTAFGVKNWKILARIARRTNSRVGRCSASPFSPLWPPGVPGSSRIYLFFPLKCKMESGSDPGGRTTTVAAPIRIHHQRFPIQLRDWLIPARNLFPPNPAGTGQLAATQQHTTPCYERLVRTIRVAGQDISFVAFNELWNTDAPQRPICVLSLSFASFPCIITPATFTFRFGHDLLRTLLIRSQDSSSTSHHRCQQASGERDLWHCLRKSNTATSPSLPVRPT
jgi:hypothetical protein